MVWYAHPMTLTFKLTALPKRYPKGFVFPKGVTPNKAGYFDRGWCFCESSVSNLVKYSSYVLDLAKFDESVEELRDVVRGCAAQRAPPLAPADFSVQLATKRFTSAKADRETVEKLYEGEFEEKIGEATTLDYRDLQWTDAEVATLCKAFASGKATKLEQLFLYGNQIGDAGAAALAEVAGKLPKLENLVLYNNQIGAAGAAALAEAAGKLPKLEGLFLDSNQIGDTGAAALAEAAGKLPKLEKLALYANPKITQQATDALKAALPNCNVSV